MALDLQQSYDSISSKTSAMRTALEVKAATKLSKTQLKDNLAKDKKKVTTTIDNIKDQKKRYQRQMKTQMDQMLSMVQFNSGSGASTMNYIKDKFIQAALKIEPKIFEIINKETIHALGCSQQQAYSAQTIYIKVKSTDIQKLLTRDPNEEVAAVAYEKVAPTQGQTPYSMNRQMWERLQNVNQPVDYFGASGQKMFTITYVQQDNNGITGDFYRIDLVDRVNGLNKVSNFIVDYYKSIKIIDTSNLFQQLMDLITNSVSFEAKLGYGELEEKNKFQLILQRILGLCFDSKQEIDVTGNSKVAELDGIDQSFFEFTDIDLRYIDEIISDTQNGVIEFEDCGNVKLPLDSRSVMDALLKFNKLDNVADEQKLASSLTKVVTDNEKWKILLPNSADVNLSVDLSFLTNLPKGIMMALLSPKVILPLLIMAKALNQLTGVAIENLTDFMKAFKKYVVALMSKIGAIFVEELFEIIKKDILQLVTQILSDITKEKILKKYAMILKLVELLMLIINLVKDWRKCKSVVDEILAILGLISGGVPSIPGVPGLSKSGSIPAPILAASELLDGFSKTRAAINVIEELQKLGLPTGPLPDGSPNLYLQSKIAEIKGVEDEREQNGKTQIFIKPLTVTPAFLTVPNGDIYGKSY